MAHFVEGHDPLWGKLTNVSEPDSDNEDESGSDESDSKPEKKLVKSDSDDEESGSERATQSSKRNSSSLTLTMKRVDQRRRSQSPKRNHQILMKNLRRNPKRTSVCQTERVAVVDSSVAQVLRLPLEMKRFTRRTLWHPRSM